MAQSLAQAAHRLMDEHNRITQKPGHRNGIANPGPCRGCPACTGLTWAELHDREADRAESEREAAASRADHEHDWQTR